MTLVIAASPLIATAASLARAPERLTARLMASPTALASTMAFSLIELGGVASAAYDSTRYCPPPMDSSMSLTEDVVISSPMSGLDLAVKSTLVPLMIGMLDLQRNIALATRATNI